MDGASGIRSVRRFEAVDLDGRTVGLLIGHTSQGEVAIGIAGPDGEEIALLDVEQQGNVLKGLRQAMMRAATGGDQ